MIIHGISWMSWFEILEGWQSCLPLPGIICGLIMRKPSATCKTSAVAGTAVTAAMEKASRQTPTSCCCCLILPMQASQACYINNLADQITWPVCPSMKSSQRRIRNHGMISQYHSQSNIIWTHQAMFYDPMSGGGCGCLAEARGKPRLPRISKACVYVCGLHRLNSCCVTHLQLARER